jgi:flagellin-like protein
MKRIQLKNNDKAVSPVIGVMLMLVVTVILAAAVSSYAGSIGSDMQKAPQLVMDVSIKNTGYSGGSFIEFNVISVSEPVQTKDLKIITSYVNSTGVRKGATVSAWDGTNNTNYTRVSTSATTTYHSPLGFGKGVGTNDQKTSGIFTTAQYFGEYSLVPGTSMRNSPWGWGTSYGYVNYTYIDFTGTDGVMAVLGADWNELRTGDIVNVKVVHIPSGQAIVDTNVGVQ